MFISFAGKSLVAKKQTNSTAVTIASKKIGDDVEMHQPTKSGSWGVFPRPKSISKTYGGGKRVGVGYSEDDDDGADLSKTRAALLSYRERFGIDVQSEKDHADEISLARETAKRMYARGVYNQAALTLEKVTSWCSSNSPVGGRVFLELGMAYEACGRTSEAITVYQTLCQSRMDDIKKDAQRLLYGIEAMDFMRNEVKAKIYAYAHPGNMYIRSKIDTSHIVLSSSYKNCNAKLSLSCFLCLYSSNFGENHEIPSNLKDPTFIIWTPSFLH